MNALSDVSISPALLQAISETLTSKESGNQPTSMHPRIKIKQEILETKNASLSGGSRTSNEDDDTNARIVNILQGMQKSSNTELGQSSQFISPDDIKNMLKLKINQSNQKPDEQGVNNLVGNFGSGEQEAMVNVLTSLAMQQAKNLNSKGVPNTEIHLGDNMTLSSPSEEVVADQGTLMIDSVGQTFYVRTSTDNSLGEGVSSVEPQLQFSTSISSSGDMSSQESMQSDVDVPCIPETTISQMDDNSMSNEGYQPCPVCGDNVSGQ